MRKNQRRTGKAGQGEDGSVQTQARTEGETINRRNREQKRAKKLRAEGFGRAEAGHKQTSAKGPRTSVAMSP